MSEGGSPCCYLQKSLLSNASFNTPGEAHLSATSKPSKSPRLAEDHRTKSDEERSIERSTSVSNSRNVPPTAIRYPISPLSDFRAPTASLMMEMSASPRMPSASPERAARSLPPTPQEGSVERKPWQNHDIPEELGNLRDDTPKEISRIIRESLKEHRAMRMSNLQARAILVRTTIETCRTDKAEGKSAAVHCEANVSARSSPSLGDSDGSSGSSLSDGSSATTPGSENEESLLQVPKKITGLSSHKVSMDSLRSQYSYMSFRSNQSQAPSPHIFASCPRMAVIESKLEESKKRTTDSQKLFRSLPTSRRKTTPPPPSFFYPRMPETHECAHCFDTVPSNHIVTGLPCRHKYCVPCFSQMVSSAISSESTFPAQCCSQKFPRAILRACLPSKALAVFDEKALEYAVPIGQRYYCASPDCARWIDTRVAKRGNGSLECPHCRTAICAVCHDLRHAKLTDCPEYSHHNNPGLKEAGGKGHPECYSCQSSFRPNHVRTPATCKCQAEICSVCGARWRTCQCSKVRQGRHEEHRARRKASDHVHYQAGEREVHSAIVAIEAAEKEIRRQEEAEELSLGSSQAKPATMEPERRQRVVRHFTQLRRILDSVRYQQRQAIEQRHHHEDRAVRQMVDARDANIARREKEIITRARARADADNDTKLKSLQHKHATTLMQTITRHRQAQDEFLASSSAKPPLGEASRGASATRSFQHESLTSEPDNNLLKASILSSLLRAQEQERLTLVAQQERELRKWRARGEQALQLAESEAREQVLQAKLEEAERIDAEARRLKWKVDADWRWFGAVWDDRKAMLQEDENRLVREGGSLDIGVEPTLSGCTRGSTPALSAQPSLPNLSRYGTVGTPRVEDALSPPPPPPPLKGRDTYRRRSPSQPRRAITRTATEQQQQQPTDKQAASAAVAATTERANGSRHVSKHRQQKDPEPEPESSPRRHEPPRRRRAPPQPPPPPPPSDDAAEEEGVEPHPGRRIHYGPTTSWMEREYARVDRMREMRGGRRMVVASSTSSPASSADVSPI